MENIFAQRIEMLRDLMRERGWDAVVITGSDPHNSEYPAARWKQPEWLTGFTGEAADVVVTMEHAGLWTDTRYFIQAEKQLADTGVVLHKTRIPEQVLIPEWIASYFEGQGDIVIATDGLCTGAGFMQEIIDSCDASGISALPAAIPDMLDSLWKNRPGIPQTPIGTVRSGEDRKDKIAWLRRFCSSQGCDSILLNALDEIAWVLDVRASDIEYNPLVISYLLVSRDSARWFVLKDEPYDPGSEESFSELEADGIEILPYSDIELELSNALEGRLFVDSSTLNYELYNALRSCDIAEGKSPVPLRKAIKNDIELQGIRNCHVRDGVVMEKFLYWLEKSVEAERDIDEWDAAVKLGQLRAASVNYVCDSFETISAYGESAALPHYCTPRDHAPKLRDSGLYLCDSGAQYLDGTTDITRTVPLGNCSALEREDYTLLLKGHIDLAMAVFPAGTPGCRLDVLARAPIWSSKRNFGHGTGHGIGWYSVVHEGPQDIRQNLNGTAFEAGMVTSNEPGIYREGRYGIRHENLMICKDAGTNGFGRWLCFETVTLCHFDTSIIVPGILDRQETEWLNAYNERVYNTLKPWLGEETSAWLRSKTLPLKTD